MGEIKSVKVDNWGVFFLQKLQNFFNKTDYCDLTLQFNDNSQLKVHRLVLNACTDYFNLLEQTCEMIDDILIMPAGLQADVVVPIVNFMYTGTLEFELKMYGRLLKTAKDMSMTVLLKLLEAHRRTMDTQTLNKSPRRIVCPDRSYNSQSTPATATATTTTSPRRSAPAYKTLQIKPVSQNIFPRVLPEPAQIVTKYPHTKTTVKGPSRFDCAEDTLPPETFEKSFDNISYESKPLICKEEPDAYDYDNLIRKHETYASPFEQLRRGYINNNNKRPASSVSSHESPPEKKPNIQDVKEYAEQQRMRKQIAEEYDDEQEYDDVLDDEFHNDDDDDDYVPPQSVRKQVKQLQQQATKASGQKAAKTENSTRPTIVVKDSTSTNVNHAKIISEVLRKYPHLVKNNKNIKLKIMPQTANNAQKIIIKKEGGAPEVAPSSPASVQEPRPEVSAPLKKVSPPAASTSAQSSAPVAAAQPRRIDSKTMHALIALGAENRTGPWLCLSCGVNGRPISIPSYRGFRRHLVNTHEVKIDPRLCEHCGWRSADSKELCYHLMVEHSVKQSQYKFPKCELCAKVFMDINALSRHIDEKHTIKKERLTCIYCSRAFTDELHLYQHMKAFHKERAIQEGILDFSDEEDSFTRDSEQLQESKIKIISDISLPKMPIAPTPGIPATATTLGLGISPGDMSADMVIESTAADDSHLLGAEYVGTDSSQGPKFVNADGNEMELTAAQREEIISQLDQQHDGIVMVLNDGPFESATTVETGGAGAGASAPSDQATENSMFIVCGQEGAETASEQSMPASLDREKSKSKDPLEWCGDENSSQSGVENVEKVKSEEKGAAEEKSDAIEEDAEKSVDVPAVAATKEAEEASKTTEEKSPGNKSPRDSLEMKLKLLTDWTDDEDEEEEEEQKKLESDLDTSKEEEELISEKNDSKGEILFETIASVEESAVAVREDLEQSEADAGKEGTDVEKSAEQPEDDGNDDEEEKEREHEESALSNDKEGDEEMNCAEEGPQESEKEDETDETTQQESKKESTEKHEKKAVSPVETNSKEEKENPNLITKAELRHIMSDWVDDDDDDEM